MIQLFNGDCLESMKGMKDNEFDLAIVDPPYGIGARTFGGDTSTQTRNSQTKFKRHDWDNEIPCAEYFEELMRVSKNQIIWGGNYFPLSEYRCFIVWDKMTYIPTMSQVELAYTSFDSPARYVKINSNQLDRFHPTQKPVALYTWLLSRYAKPGNKILDTHLGSGSIAIACHNMGYDLVGYELDEDYFQAAKKRLEEHQKQLRLF